MVKGLKLRLYCHESSSDFYVLSLVGADVNMGVQGTLEISYALDSRGGSHGEN
jgi:hypothetical protein